VSLYAEPAGDRLALAYNIELSAGAHGAAARLELHDRPVGRLALLVLRGWIDAVALGRLERALEDIAARGVDRLVLDCGPLRHIDYRAVPALVEALSRFERRAAPIAVCGLSRYLRDLFRLAGCEGRLTLCASATDLLDPDTVFEPSRETAS
jgi:anti-anti-sigma factor